MPEYTYFVTDTQAPISHMPTLCLGRYTDVSDNDVRRWLEKCGLPVTAAEAVTSGDNYELVFFGLTMRTVRTLHSQYMPDPSQLSADCAAVGIDVTADATLAEVLTVLYHTDPDRAEKYY
nr:MAG TPA: hypothetical protein [Caudoviricetes sp.]